MTAKTIVSVLPHEDSKELESKTQQATKANKPRNPYELEMICRVARLEWELDRAERVATTHLAHRVRMVEVLEPGTVCTEELREVQELGSKLFFVNQGPGTAKCAKRSQLGIDARLDAG